VVVAEVLWAELAAMGDTRAMGRMAALSEEKTAVASAMATAAGAMVVLEGWREVGQKAVARSEVGRGAAGRWAVGCWAQAEG